LHIRGLNFLPMVAAALAAACASIEGIHTTATPVDPAALEAAKTFAGAPAVRAPLEATWWKRYGDPQLDALVEESFAGNPSIAIVQARVEQARAAAALAHTALTPHTNGSVSSSRQRFSENSIIPPPFGGTWLWQNDATVTLDYEFDFWGKNRKAYESSVGLVRAAAADAEAARLLLAVAVTRAYIQLQASYEQRDVAAATLTEREQILSLTRARFDAGLDARLAVEEAEGQVPSSRDQVIAAEQAIELARHQIAALLGRGPDRGLDIARPALAPIDVALPSTLPADLVGRRPDVAAQRERVQAAMLGIESQKAAFYPNIDLNVFVGLQALSFEKWLEASSLTAGIGPAINLPWFHRGSLRAGLEARSADWDLAVGQYNQTLVDAVREVVDQVATARALKARQEQVALALASAERAQDLSVARYRAGVGNYLEVLLADRQVLLERALAAELRARRLDADVDLIHALGGGYDNPAPLAAAH
jgi:NodT family efflux transporter outer membrane factor (OMF) lipoprotein